MIILYARRILDHIVNNRRITSLDEDAPVVIQLAHDVLQVTNLGAAATWTIIHQSYPSKIFMSDGFDPDVEVVAIPEFVVDALLNYVAWKGYKPRGSNDSNDSSDKGNVYHQQYELAMTKLEMYGLDPQDGDKENTFESDGWA